MLLSITNLGKVSEFYLRGDVLAVWHGYFVITVYTINTRNATKPRPRTPPAYT